MAWSLARYASAESRFDPPQAVARITAAAAIAGSDSWRQRIEARATRSEQNGRRGRSYSGCDLGIGLLGRRTLELHRRLAASDESRARPVWFRTRRSRLGRGRVDRAFEGCGRRVSSPSLR